MNVHFGKIEVPFSYCHDHRVMSFTQQREVGRAYQVSSVVEPTPKVQKTAHESTSLRAYLGEPREKSKKEKRSKN